MQRTAARSAKTHPAQLRERVAGSIWARRIPVAWLPLSALLAVLGALPLVREVDPDFWWHLRTGEIIASSGIPQTDPFSWTAGGQPWTLHEWLSELIIYVTQVSVGYGGNVALFSGVTVGAMCVMYSAARREGAGDRALMLLMFFASVMMLRFIAVRPQAFSWLLFAVFVAIIARRDRGEAAPIWLLPPLMALWANLHLGFVYGLMVVALWGVSKVVERLRGRDVDLKAPAIVALACGFATLVTPSGIDIVAYPLRYLEDSGSTQYIEEWRRPDFRDPLMAPCLLAIVMLTAALVSKDRPRPFMLLVSAAVIALSLLAVRSMPFVALMLIAVGAPALAGRRPWASRAAESKKTVALGTATLGLVAFAAVIVAGVLTAGMRVTLGAPAERGYPQEGAAYLEASLGERRLFNDYTWGGYLIYRLYPKAPLFIDGRSDFYRARIMEEYAAIARVEHDWETLLDAREVDVVLVRAGSTLAQVLQKDSEWRVVLSGEREVVFERRASR